ncbi:hypothetical protein acdb102_27540 [Acidothermaceae bacterium B102]|nr:hypothetical protein acdb102_27540 [Acidothermaceae bacterium B102]
MRRGTPTSRSRLIAAGVTAPLVVALSCGSAAPALAASHTAKPKDPLAAVRAKALADLTVYGKRLAVVLKAGAGSTLLSADEVLGLHDAGVLQGVALRDDRVAVDRAKNKKAIAAAVAAGSRTLRVAGLELSVSLAAETHLAASSDISDAAATLSDDATTAAAAGDDTTDLTDALDNVSVDLESAQGDESTAVSDVMSLDNAATAPALAAAAAASVDDLATIDQDISDATDDLSLAQDADDALSGGDTTDPGDGGADSGDGGGGGTGERLK